MYVEVLVDDPVQVTVFVIVDVGTPTSIIAVPPRLAVFVVVNKAVPLVIVVVSVGIGTSTSTTTVPSEV